MVTNDKGIVSFKHKIMEEVCDSSARLVCNRVSLKTKRERIQWLIDGISEQIVNG